MRRRRNYKGINSIYSFKLDLFCFGLNCDCTQNDFQLLDQTNALDHYIRIDFIQLQTRTNLVGGNKAEVLCIQTVYNKEAFNLQFAL